jgi:translation initiation factor 5B
MYWENKDTTEYISMIPTSAMSGDGVGNLMAYICYYAQTYLKDRITFHERLDCTVLEVCYYYCLIVLTNILQVKSLPGLGTTIDVILVNGRLRYGDTIVIAGTEGAITTQVRELLMPQPLKEMRVKVCVLICLFIYLLYFLFL